MQKIKVGIIGLGIGVEHIEGYRSHLNCEVVSLCDFSKEKFNLISQSYSTMKVTQNASEILEDPDIKIVSIASFDNYHHDQVIAALNLGKHVFVEKPLCLHPWEAKNIRRCLNEHPDLKLSSNLVLRTCPKFIRIKDAVQSGEMGRLFYIEGDYLWGRIHKLCDGWRAKMDFYSIVYGAALHMIDLIIWIAGMLPTEVQAYGNKIATDGTSLRYNSFAAILMKFEDDTIAKVTANGGCVHPHFHRLTVFGTKKTAIHDVIGSKWIDTNIPNGKYPYIPEEYPAKEKRRGVITSFIDSIMDDSIQPIVSCKDVFDTMSVCFAVEQAINQSYPVKVNYV